MDNKRDSHQREQILANQFREKYYMDRLKPLKTYSDCVKLSHTFMKLQAAQRIPQRLNLQQLLFTESFLRELSCALDSSNSLITLEPIRSSIGQKIEKISRGQNGELKEIFYEISIQCAIIEEEMEMTIKYLLKNILSKRIRSKVLRFIVLGENLIDTDFIQNSVLANLPNVQFIEVKAIITPKAIIQRDIDTFFPNRDFYQDQAAIVNEDCLILLKQVQIRNIYFKISPDRNIDCKTLIDLSYQMKLTLGHKKIEFKPIIEEIKIDATNEDIAQLLYVWTRLFNDLLRVSIKNCTLISAETFNNFLKSQQSLQLLQLQNVNFGVGQVLLTRSVTTLQLSSCYFHQESLELSHLKDLNVLIFDVSPIKSLKTKISCIDKLEKLVHLNLYGHNQVDNIFIAKISAKKCLKHLNIGFTSVKSSKLSDAVEILSEFQSLQDLNLDENDISIQNLIDSGSNGFLNKIKRLSIAGFCQKNNSQIFTNQMLEQLIEIFANLEYLSIKFCRDLSQINWSMLEKICCQRMKINYLVTKSHHEGKNQIVFSEMPDLYSSKKAFVERKKFMKKFQNKLQRQEGDQHLEKNRILTIQTDIVTFQRLSREQKPPKTDHFLKWVLDYDRQDEQNCRQQMMSSWIEQNEQNQSSLEEGQIDTRKDNSANFTFY